jgi:hypothetical protein
LALRKSSILAFSSLRLAAAHVAGVQASVADGVLLAQPGEEALETETVATVRGGAVSVREVS